MESIIHVPLRSLYLSHTRKGLKMNENKTQCIIFAIPKFIKQTGDFQIIIDSLYGNALWELSASGIGSISSKYKN